jgi:D-lactate dehydrogenase
VPWDRAAREALAERVGPRLIEAPAAIERFRRDASHFVGDLVGVVAPRDEEEVVGLVRWARQYDVALVARGGGTSLDGESVPRNGALVVDLAGWNRILEVDVASRWARVQPGVVNAALQEALGPDGLFFPPNPGSWTSSTLGGNASTNASGPRSFRYGPTRSWVLAARAVLGTGDRVEVGSRAAKRSIGPDLLQLLIGSEGTLGIFTELTLRLAPRPARRAVLVAPVPDDLSWTRAAAELGRSGLVGLSALEYLDRTCAAALARVEGSRLPGDSPLLLVELESDSEAAESECLERLGRWLRALGAVSDPSVAADADRLWTLRGQSGTALDRAVGARIREDVAVPIGQLDALRRALEQLAAAYNAPLWVYGHLGEGSLHPNFGLAPGSPAGERLRTELLATVLALGGTVSAEHGIGEIKRDAWSKQVGPAAEAGLRAIKRVLDPSGVLNPGKVLPDLVPAPRAAQPP